jgi:peptide/nickel transport system ATP-binding protein
MVLNDATGETLLRVSNLKTYFHTLEGLGKAVDGVDFEVGKGAIVGIVGESGCGKSVTALSILRLVPQPPGRIENGKAIFEGIDLLKISDSEIRGVRGNKISMIFQEPMRSLNPVYTIGDQIAETIMLHQKMTRKDAWARATEMLGHVQMPEPHIRAYDYPHKLSGGMRQRAMIAMALSCNPQLLIADEPTTALDVTIQAQILDLMLRLKEELGMAIVLITHNLGLIAEVAEKVIVMYAGKIVEEAEVFELFENPLHPYTVGLLQSIPWVGRRREKGRKALKPIPGLVPNLFDLPLGCRFAARCEKSMGICQEEEPEIKEIKPNHRVTCWLFRK